MNTQTQISTTATATNNITVSVKALALLLGTITKSTVVSLTYFVDESKSRQVGGAKQVQKRVKVNNLYLNHNYTNKVNNIIKDKQHGKGGFVAQELKGKERITSTILSSLSSKNYGKLMLDGKILKTESTQVLGYFHNGKQIQLNKGNSEFGRTDLVAPSFYQKSTYTSGRGTVSEENDFRMITPFLDAIESIKVQGKVYSIIG
jgi:hypothetical protein